MELWLPRLPWRQKNRNRLLRPKKAKKIHTLYKQPGKLMSNLMLENTPEAMQSAIGGYIETVTIAPNCVVICNEEARILDLEFNCVLHGVSFAGPILIVGLEGKRKIP